MSSPPLQRPAEPHRRLTLTSLRVRNLGPLEGELDLGPLADGLTVISGPNETGKSTLIAGLRAAFFERHTAKNKALRALQPHGTNAAPELWLSFRHDGRIYDLHKRFLVKPVAELRADDGALLAGAEAEARLREILGSSEPGKQGARLDDMGLWGLLWVGQDEAAYTDPGQHLGDSTRGTIQEAIERQVASVTGGGRAAELLRAKARDEYLRYWTEKTHKPSGEYRDALDAVHQAKAALAAAQRDLDETRDLRAQVRSLESQRRALGERGLPELRARVEATRAEEERLRRAEDRLTAAREARDKAAALAAAARARQDERRTLVEAVRRAQATVLAEREAVAELEPLVAAARAERARAQERVRAAEAARDRAREALEAARSALRRAERWARRQALAAKRRQLAEVRAQAEGVHEDLGATLADAPFQELREAHRAHEEARAALERVATRFELRVGGGEGGSAASRPLSLALGRPEDVVWPGSDETGSPLTLRLTPAGEGLRDAVSTLRQRERALAEALHPLHVSLGDAARADGPTRAVQAVRRLRDQRSEEETRYRLAQETLGDEAPEGLDTLRAQAQDAESQVAALGERERRARELEAVIAEAQARMREAGVSPEILAELERLQHRLDVAIAVRDARATRVVVRALRATRVQWLGDGPGEGPDGDGGDDSRALEGEETLSRHLTRATTLRVGDEAEVRVEPGGERLADVAAEVGEAQRRLADALAAQGCAGLEEARRRERAYQAARGEAQAAQAALEELAPGEGGEGGRAAGGGAPGLAGLVAAREAAEARRRELAERLRRANEAQERARVAAARRDENPVTAEVLARVEELGREVAQARAVVERLSAQVALVSPGPEGASAGEAGGEGPWSFAEPGEAALGGAGRAVWVEPGEGGAAEDALARRALARWEEALEAAGVPDLAAAEAAWRRGLTLREQARALAEQEARLVAEMAELGPEAEGLDGADGPDAADGEAPDLEAARRAATDAEEAERGAQQALEAARREEAQAGERGVEAETELRDRRAARERAEQEAEAAAQRLEAARAVAGDEALEEDVRRQRVALEERSEALAQATAARDEAAAALVEPDALERAKAALVKAQKQDEAWGQELARLEGKLDTVLRKGRYDAFKAAEAELVAAQGRLAGVTRRARAAAKLWEVLSEEYEDYQRRFLAPIVRRARPYLRAVRPDSELRMTPDFRVQAVLRRGVEEGFESLSGGTREQLSVIVRLAFAGMLAESHGALPLILDDTMGWTDDERFGKMVRILEDAARTMQILVLTCHPSRFAALDAARTIDLGRLKREARLR